jgi:Domain of unknown function (DUF1850)
VRPAAAGALLAALAGLALLAAATPPAPPPAGAPAGTAVAVADETGGRPLALLPVDGDAPLQLRYVHSVYRRPATEEFAVRPDGLYLVRLASPSAAVLEYYARPEPVTATGDGFEIRLARPERFPGLSVLASEAGERTVVYAGRELPLHRLAGPGHRVSLSLTAAGSPRP